MAVERCARCGTARRGDMQVCVRCETPFAADPDVDLQRPAAPSKLQTHGTMAAAVVLGVVLMGVLLALSVRKVGPIKAEIMSERANGATVTLTVRVTNGGDRAGRGSCRVQVVSESNVATNVAPFLTERIPGNSSITRVVDVPTANGKPRQVTCA